MPTLAFLFLAYLALIKSGVLALALVQMATTVAFASVPAPTLSPAPNLVNTSDPMSDVCIYLHGCRKLSGIIQSCLVTIFACVWVAVHRNIPGPKQTWLSTHLCWLKVVFLTLLVPEWVLAWAVRQCVGALRLAKEFEEARIAAHNDRGNKEHALAAKRKESARRGSGEGQRAESEIELAETVSNDKTQTVMDASSAGTSGEVVPDTWTRQTRLGRTNKSWTTTHAYFIIMGGFHFYKDGEPLHPLSPRDVLDLVRRGELVPPTLDELNDKSKCDSLSKGVAIVQTLWFITQCIARRIDHLATTALEIMTLAYTFITVAMYTAWWCKPLNIRCPERVLVPAVDADPDYRLIWERTFYHVMGGQDTLVMLNSVLGAQDQAVRLSQEERVPTFWAGANGDDICIGDVVALLAAMVFGSVHCIAWSYAFPSHMEQLMWRMSAATIVVVPVVIALHFVVGYLFRGVSDKWRAKVWIVPMVPYATAYITARVLLLVVSFTALRSLPFAAYQTVQWTTFIPHL